MGARRAYGEWSAEEEGQLATLVATGATSDAIAGKMGRSKASIDNKRRHLNLTTPKPSKVKPLTKGDIDAVTPAEVDRKRLRQLETVLRDLEKKQAEIIGSQYRLNLPRVRKRSTRGGYLRVIAGDLHGQQMDPAAFSAFVTDVADIRPAEIVILGDWIDCGGWLAEHPTLHLGETEGSFADDIAAGNQSLDALQQAAPGARIWYLEGNHEWRIIKTMLRLVKGNKTDAVLMKKLWGIKRLLNLDERGIEFIPHDSQQPGLKVRGCLKLGDWLFSHGPFKSCGKTAIDRNLSRLKTNFAQGHVHRFTHATQQSAESQTLHGYSFGCLCKMAPLYMENSPTDWSHGYGLQEVDKDGSAVTWPVQIEEGVSRLNTLTRRMA